MDLSDDACNVMSLEQVTCDVCGERLDLFVPSRLKSLS